MEKRFRKASVRNDRIGVTTFGMPEVEYIQAPTSILDFHFRARICTISRTGHWARDRICGVCAQHREIHSCSESTFDSILRLHKRPKLGSLLLFFQRGCEIIYNLKDVPVFSFAWRWWFGYHTRIEYCYAFRTSSGNPFLDGTSTTLITTIESPVVWSKTCRSSSAVSVSLGYHSPLGPSLSALHSLDELIPWPHE